MPCNLAMLESRHPVCGRAQTERFFVQQTHIGGDASLGSYWRISDGATQNFGQSFGSDFLSMQRNDHLPQESLMDQKKATGKPIALSAVFRNQWVTAARRGVQKASSSD